VQVRCMSTMCRTVITALVVLALANAFALDLKVKVIPADSKVSGTDDAAAVLVFTNTGTKKMCLYGWCVPKSATIKDNMLAISRNGTTVHYEGPVAKRLMTPDTATICLEPGENITSASVKLSSAYDMSEGGSYTIRYKKPLHMVQYTSTKNKAKTGNQILQSPAILVTVGATQQAKGKTVVNKRAASILVKGKITTKDCTEEQTADIVKAVNQGRAYAQEAVNYLSNQDPNSSPPRFTTWFGPSSSASWDKITLNFERINDALETESIIADCSCLTDPEQQQTFAYVYRAKPYTIYICKQFVNGPLKGSNSQGGTFVHEVSHFTVVANTNDNAYGEDACQTLAETNVAKAITNADSHEFFC